MLPLSCLLLGLALVPSSVRAAPFLGVSFLESSAGYSGRLYSIDTSPPSASAIGTVGYRDLNSLAASPDGFLYSVGRPAAVSQLPRELIRIDPQTGVGTSLAPIGPGVSTPGNQEIPALAVHPSSGVIYGINGGYLVTIDPATGLMHGVGYTGFAFIQGLTFSNDATLYGWDVQVGLVQIALGTGGGFDVNPSVGGSADIQTIEFGPHGVLYGARDALFTIDATTGVTTLVGAVGNRDLRGLAYLPEPKILTLLLAGVALAVSMARPQGLGTRASAPARSSSGR